MGPGVPGVERQAPARADGGVGCGECGSPRRQIDAHRGLWRPVRPARTEFCSLFANHRKSTPPGRPAKPPRHGAQGVGWRPVSCRKRPAAQTPSPKIVACGFDFRPTGPAWQPAPLLRRRLLGLRTVSTACGDRVRRSGSSRMTAIRADRTAMRRTSLSRPVALAVDDGLIGSASGSKVSSAARPSRQPPTSTAPRSNNSHRCCGSSRAAVASSPAPSTVSRWSSSSVAVLACPYLVYEDFDRVAHPGPPKRGPSPT